MENQEERVPVFFRGTRYGCPLDLTLELIGGKWKPRMIYRLRTGSLRSSCLQRLLPGISNKMFTQTARELERDGLVRRTVFPVVPPKVEYGLTAAGRSLLPLLERMSAWGAGMAAAEE